jgi:hypothetical protein
MFFRVYIFCPNTFYTAFSSNIVFVFVYLHCFCVFVLALGTFLLSLRFNKYALH